MKHDEFRVDEATGPGPGSCNWLGRRSGLNACGAPKVSVDLGDATPLHTADMALALRSAYLAEARVAVS